MLLKPEDIDEFIKVYFEASGETLSPKEAREAFTRLLQLFAILARPLPSEGVDQFAKHRTLDMLNKELAVQNGSYSSDPIV